MKIVFRGFFLSCASLLCAHAQPAPHWDAGNAAAYLDGRMEWWMTWKSAARDHDTFCLSCHTSAPYALGRAALRDALGEKGATPDELRLIENVTRRVRMWNEVAPFYPDGEKSPGKTRESRGTEAVLNALVLSFNDKTRTELSADSRLAFDHLWAEQISSGDAKGAFEWLQFHNAPFEGDSQYYGAALAAVAVGHAPAGYRNSPAIQENLHALRDYLVKQRGAQKPIDQLVLLWASAALPDLLTASQCKEIIADTLSRQRDDGGFSLSSMVGAWQRKDNTPLETASDGYATGLTALALQEAGVKAGNPALLRSLQWLREHQQADGHWIAYSLNKERDLASDAGRFMSDAATAYAVMALEAARP